MLTDKSWLEEALRGVLDLSEREREVAELVAFGYSNDEIADCVYVERRTVERHIGRVISKLGLGHKPVPRVRVAIAWHVRHGSLPAGPFRYRSVDGSV